MAEKTENLSISEKLNDFIQKNRIILVASLGGMLVLLIIIIAVFTVRDQLQSRALSRVEELNRRFEALDIFTNSDTPETAFINEEVTVLLEDLDLFAKKNSGYAAARSYAISANIYEEMKNWAEAETAWVNAARVGAKTYLAPVAFFNAAVAAEEQGNINRAIELYHNALEYENIFPAAPRAQFSIGRLQETQGDNIGALSSYMLLVSKWPQDQIWANLAHNRITFFSME